MGKEFGRYSGAARSGSGRGSSPVLLCGVGEEDVLVVILDELMRRLADCRQ